MTQKALIDAPVYSDPSRAIAVSLVSKFDAVAHSGSAAAPRVLKQNQHTFAADGVQKNDEHETSDYEDPWSAQGQPMVCTAHTMKSDIGEVPWSMRSIVEMISASRFSMFFVTHRFLK